MNANKSSPQSYSIMRGFLVLFLWDFYRKPIGPLAHILQCIVIEGQCAGHMRKIDSVQKYYAAVLKVLDFPLKMHCGICAKGLNASHDHNLISFEESHNQCYLHLLKLGI